MVRFLIKIMCRINEKIRAHINNVIKDNVEKVTVTAIKKSKSPKPIVFNMLVCSLNLA
ncbi:hypothetical protein GCM10022291_18390 [Postechiella marina]|uniref:Uncharacterized protein n=1 Tax=Postechiella marina TaxID=943941 RepID=A0ABP8C8T5_9FLAO